MFYYYFLRSLIEQIYSRVYESDQIRSTNPKKLPLHSFFQITVDMLGGKALSMPTLDVSPNTRVFCSEPQIPSCRSMEEPGRALATFTPAGTVQWQRGKGRVGSLVFEQSPFYNKHAFTQAKRRHILRGATFSRSLCPRPRRARRWLTHLLETSAAPSLLPTSCRILPGKLTDSCELSLPLRGKAAVTAALEKRRAVGSPELRLRWGTLGFTVSLSSDRETALTSSSF